MTQRRTRPASARRRYAPAAPSPIPAEQCQRAGRLPRPVHQTTVRAIAAASLGGAKNAVERLSELPPRHYPFKTVEWTYRPAWYQRRGGSSGLIRLKRATEPSTTAELIGRCVESHASCTV